MKVVTVAFVSIAAGVTDFLVEVLAGAINPWVMHAPVGSWVSYWSLLNIVLIIGGLVLLMWTMVVLAVLEFRR
jgi:hypothetical protein